MGLLISDTMTGQSISMPLLVTIFLVSTGDASKSSYPALPIPGFSLNALSAAINTSQGPAMSRRKIPGMGMITISFFFSFGMFGKDYIYSINFGHTGYKIVRPGQMYTIEMMAKMTYFIQFRPIRCFSELT